MSPTKDSSGTSCVQGSITKAGNARVRRLLIESACHHRAVYPNPGPTMRARWAKVDPVPLSFCQQHVSDARNQVLGLRIPATYRAVGRRASVVRSHCSRAVFDAGCETASNSLMTDTSARRATSAASARERQIGR
ncbi:transposase [Mycolicibacterium cosmeticum]|uniref:transposase n=1 Tax=Mycolicibacterium cosmeticum TaxID=258533 RepID=UPI0022867337|nr:transposase [Mycolicibacterium cosmeticum]